MRFGGVEHFFGLGYGVSLFDQVHGVLSLIRNSSFPLVSMQCSVVIEPGARRRIDRKNVWIDTFGSVRADHWLAGARSRSKNLPLRDNAGADIGGHHYQSTMDVSHFADLLVWSSLDQRGFRVL